MRVILKDGVDWKKKYGFRAVNPPGLDGMLSWMLKDFGKRTLLIFNGLTPGECMVPVSEFLQTAETKAFLVDLLIADDATISF